MNTYVIKFRPFQNAFNDEMTAEAASLVEAEANFVKMFPKGIVLSLALMILAEVDNVIYVDFKQRKRVTEDEHIYGNVG